MAINPEFAGQVALVTGAGSGIGKAALSTRFTFGLLQCVAATSPLCRATPSPHLTCSFL